MEENKMNKGHGHVFPRPDGVRMRCGGPGLCPDCSLDFVLNQNQINKDKSSDKRPQEDNKLDDLGMGI